MFAAVPRNLSLSSTSPLVSPCLLSAPHHLLTCYVLAFLPIGGRSFIETFSSAARMQSESEYQFCSLTSAVTFIETATAENFTIDKDDFERYALCP